MFIDGLTIAQNFGRLLDGSDDEEGLSEKQVIGFLSEVDALTKCGVVSEAEALDLGTKAIVKFQGMPDEVDDMLCDKAAKIFRKIEFRPKEINLLRDFCRRWGFDDFYDLNFKDDKQEGEIVCLSLVFERRKKLLPIFFKQIVPMFKTKFDRAAHGYDIKVFPYIPNGFVNDDTIFLYHEEKGNIYIDTHKNNELLSYGAPEVIAALCHEFHHADQFMDIYDDNGNLLPEGKGKKLLKLSQIFCYGKDGISETESYNNDPVELGAYVLEDQITDYVSALQNSRSRNR